MKESLAVILVCFFTCLTSNSIGQNWDFSKVKSLDEAYERIEDFSKEENPKLNASLLKFLTLPPKHSSEMITSLHKKDYPVCKILLKAEFESINLIFESDYLREQRTDGQLEMIAYVLLEIYGEDHIDKLFLREDFRQIDVKAKDKIYEYLNNPNLNKPGFVSTSYSSLGKALEEASKKRQETTLKGKGDSQDLGDSGEPLNRGSNRTVPTAVEDIESTEIVVLETQASDETRFSVWAVVVGAIALLIFVVILVRGRGQIT